MDVQIGMNLNWALFGGQREIHPALVLLAARAASLADL